MYIQHGVNLSEKQAKKIVTAHNKSTGVSIKLSKNNLHGSFMLPLTQSQVNNIEKTTGGMTLTLSKSQLKHMEKNGGFIPLLALIPALAAALGGAGGLAGGIASAVNSTRNANEQIRHNKAMEEQSRNSNVTGNGLTNALKKLGLGIKDMQRLDKNNCVCHEGLEIRKTGNGLFLSPC